MKDTKTIKVVHIGTEISNSSAPLRIHKAVKGVGVDSKIVTLKSSVSRDDIYEVKRHFLYRCLNKIISYKENYLLGKFKEKENVPFSFGQMGISITKNKMIQQADILHLHWINGQFLSYKEINKLANMGKTIVWTFHDSWPMTGGCHVRYGCDRFMQACGCCPELHSTKQNDITNRIMRKKHKYFAGENMVIVCPSKWMCKNVKCSSVFSKCRIKKIGNPLDLRTFCNHKQQVMDDKIRILFGASGALELEYKGYKYFVEALNYIKEKHSDIANRIVIQIFGTQNSSFEGLEGFKSEALGYIQTEEEMAKVYGQADIYVFPSIDDNLPGTVMESLACETPVVAFETGGVPEMVQHKENGYVAQYKNAIDLAEGILWVIGNNQGNSLGTLGRKFIEKNFEMQCIGQKYYELYKDELEKKQ